MNCPFYAEDLTARVNDQPTLLPLLKATRERVGIRPKILLAFIENPLLTVVHASVLSRFRYGDF